MVPARPAGARGDRPPIRRTGPYPRHQAVIVHRADRRLDGATVEQALKSLERAGLISTEKVLSGHITRVRTVSGRAHPLTGLWPDERSVVDRLIAAIEQAMETATPERRPFLQRARDHLAALPQDAALAVGAALLGGFGG